MQRNIHIQQPTQIDTRANGGERRFEKEKNSLNRKRMYNRVLRVLDNLIFPQNNEDLWSDENKSSHNAEVYEQNIGEFLNRAQQYEDACFHNDLYTYLLGRNENARYERLPSKYVEMFLHRMIEKTATLDKALRQRRINITIHCQIYIKNNCSRRQPTLVKRQRGTKLIWRKTRN